MSSHSLPVLFTTEAQDDLEALRLYSRQEWGGEQEAIYTAALLRALGIIGENPAIRPRAPRDRRRSALLRGAAAQHLLPHRRRCGDRRAYLARPPRCAARAGRVTVSDSVIIAGRRGDGTIVRVLLDGGERPFPLTPMRGMATEEIEAAALAHPDARPLTADHLAAVRRRRRRLP